MIQTWRKLKAGALPAALALLLAHGFTCPVAGQDPSSGGQSIAPGAQARVFITSDPGGQMLTVDGRRVDAATPLTLDLDPGKYSLRVSAEGYHALSHELTVGPGEQMDLKFILLQVRPRKPSPAQLRSMSSQFEWEAGGGGPPGGTGDDEAWKAVQKDNDACMECHPSIPKLHSEGAHRTISCGECHGAYSDHVKGGKMIAEMPVVSGKGIQTMCLNCHDEAKRNDSWMHAKKITLPGHLEEKRVRAGNFCSQCHHVHSPLKWVHEAREMVGLPERMAILPLLSENTAYKVKERFNSLSETLLVIPLALGIIGKFAFPSEENYPANEFLVSGSILITASYVLGRIFHSKKLAKTKAINAQREAANARAKEYNQMVDKAMAEYYQAVIRWDTESEKRGKVIVQKR